MIASDPGRIPVGWVAPSGPVAPAVAPPGRTPAGTLARAAPSSAPEPGSGSGPPSAADWVPVPASSAASSSRPAWPSASVLSASGPAFGLGPRRLPGPRLRDGRLTRLRRHADRLQERRQALRGRLLHGRAVVEPDRQDDRLGVGQDIGPLVAGRSEHGTAGPLPRGCCGFALTIRGRGPGRVATRDGPWVARPLQRASPRLAHPGPAGEAPAPRPRARTARGRTGR